VLAPAVGPYTLSRDMARRGSARPGTAKRAPLRGPHAFCSILSRAARNTRPLRSKKCARAAVDRSAQSSSATTQSSRKAGTRSRSSNDPTAHAEIVAIRCACALLGAFNPTDFDIYTSCEPCPMCLGAIYWARLRRIYYSSAKRIKRAEKIPARSSFRVRNLRPRSTEIIRDRCCPRPGSA
jgi:deoxycytidylate deaminase